MYLITDKKCGQPREFLILPYLHERRIYMNRIKINTDYLYTCIETTDDQIKDYENSIEPISHSVLHKMGIQHKHEDHNP